MLCGGESGHVGSGLGDDDVGGVPTDAGDGADQVAEAAKGFDHHLDSIGELLDGRGVLVDQIQVHAGQERVMVGEPAGQSASVSCGIFTRSRFLASSAMRRRIAFRRRSGPPASPARTRR